jgi:hypothetical protein
MDLAPTTTSIGITAGSLTYTDDFLFECRGVAQSDPMPTDWQCSVYSSLQGANANFSNDDFQTNVAEMQGHVCADGSFHFTTALLNDDSNSLQNRVQVTLYGQLF